MLKATKSCLDSLITKDSFPIELGYANSNNMDVWTEDLAKGGLGITCLNINNKKYPYYQKTRKKLDKIYTTTKTLGKYTLLIDNQQPKIYNCNFKNKFLTI